MTTLTRPRISALAAGALAACTAPAADADVPAGSAEAHPTATVPALDLTGPWTVAAGDGTPVTLELRSGRLAPGRAALAVRVPDAGAARVRSLDLVSPTMPMHGLVRYEVVDGRAHIDIPMEGRWAVYVNLDETGANHAEFVFDVPAARGSGHDHAGGH